MKKYRTIGSVSPEKNVCQVFIFSAIVIEFEPFHDDEDPLCFPAKRGQVLGKKHK